MKHHTAAFVTVLLSVSSAVAMATPQQFSDGVPTTRLAEISKLLPVGSRVESVRLFNDFQKKESSIAVLITRRGRWEIYAFSPKGKQNYAVTWRSGALPQEFAVATPSLRVEQVNEHDAVGFNGCAPHMCPDIFASLVYVPALSRDFIGSCRDGKTELSFDVSEDTKDVREYLLTSLANADVSKTACGADVRAFDAKEKR